MTIKNVELPNGKVIKHQDDMITLINGVVLRIVASDAGTTVEIMSETVPGKTVGSLAYSNFSHSMISARVHDRAVEYKCQECEAEFTADEAGTYCSECGADSVFLIEEENDDED